MRFVKVGDLAAKPFVVKISLNDTQPLKPVIYGVCAYFMQVLVLQWYNDN